MNTLHLFRKYRGFTLIELMVVLVILSIVMMAIYSLYLTHQRSAYTQDEVVEVQQNLRIGMESMTRDIRMAGFLSSTTPIGTNPAGGTAIGNGTGIAQPLPAPDNINSDTIIITTASASGKVARLSGAPAGAVCTVDDPLSVDPFLVNNVVTIIRPGNKLLPAGTGSSFTINAINRATPSITFTAAPAGTFIAGDLIVETGGTTYPSTITYCLGPAAGCGNTVTTCPTGQLCLMRIVNGGTADAIAQNMAGLQFSYLMDDNTACGNPECPNPPLTSYSSIRAVRATLIGQTVKTTALSDNKAKQRRIESVIMIRNR